MTPSILVLAAIVALAASAYRALAPGAEKIPMQWSLRAKVNWSARRLMAFGFVPALALAIFILLIVSGRPAETISLSPAAFFSGVRLCTSRSFAAGLPRGRPEMA